jgi:hypothetical protein
VYWSVKTCKFGRGAKTLLKAALDDAQRPGRRSAAWTIRERRGIDTAAQWRIVRKCLTPDRRLERRASRRFRPRTESGHRLKSSVRADVFCSSPNNGHQSHSHFQAHADGCLVPSKHLACVLRKTLFAFDDRARSAGRAPRDLTHPLPNFAAYFCA